MTKYIYFYFSGNVETVEEKAYKLMKSNKIRQVCIRVNDIMAVYGNLQCKKKLKYDKEGTDNIKKKFQCQKCGRSYVHQGYLNVHKLKECVIQSKFVCDFCGYKSNRKGNLLIHIRNVHLKTGKYVGHENDKRKERERTYKCNKCGRSYAHLGTLNSHIRCECGVKRKFKCDFCGYDCNHKGNLRAHISNVHLKKREYVGHENDKRKEPERTHKCNKCGRSYVHQSSLNSHKRYECGVKRIFECDFCGYKSNHKGNLHVHIRNVHLKTEKKVGHENDKRKEPERNHKCNICGRSYLYRNGLYRHKKFSCNILNEPESRLKCNKCARSYANQSSFNIHLKTCEYDENMNDNRKTPEQKLSCYHCGQKYNEKISLLRHIVTQHLKK